MMGASQYLCNCLNGNTSNGSTKRNQFPLCSVHTTLRKQTQICSSIYRTLTLCEHNHFVFLVVALGLSASAIFSLLSCERSGWYYCVHSAIQNDMSHCVIYSIWLCMSIYEFYLSSPCLRTSCGVRITHPTSSTSCFLSLYLSFIYVQAASECSIIFMNEMQEKKRRKNRQRKWETISLLCDVANIELNESLSINFGVLGIRCRFTWNSVLCHFA